MENLEAEMIHFFIAFITGCIIVCGYRCIEILRTFIPHAKVVVGIEDGLFWVVTSFYLFYQIYQTSDGKLRWYWVVGAGAGLFISQKIYKQIEKRY